MRRTTTSGPTIIVAGDVTIDWNVARLTSAHSDTRTWNANATTRACGQPGGVCMLADLVAVATADITRSRKHVALHTVKLPPPPRHPGEKRFAHSYAMWEPHLLDSRDKKSGAVWRVKDFLGLDGSCVPPGECRPLLLPAATPRTADLIVLDDAKLGFRDHRRAWPKALDAVGEDDWVLVKMSNRVAEGPLWDHLVTQCARRTVVVMTANDLRGTDVHISRELSWERTAQDLYWELTHNPVVETLAKCAHVVVSFGTAGVFLLSRAESKAGVPSWNCRLFFDPETYEGAWGPQHAGGVIGQTSCLTAAVARQLLLKPKRPDLSQAIQAGVATMRHLKKHGYGPQPPAGPLSDPKLPLADLAGLLQGGGAGLAEAVVEDPVRYLRQASQPGQTARSEGFWTILDDVCSEGECALSDGKRESLLDRACEVVLHGPEAALKRVPLGKFGGLTTADRREIEAFHAVGSLIAEYCSKPQKQPLSIAVFGPPGSGKSFGVKQVAKSLGQDNIVDKTFNLSQYNEPKELIQALHQVRDEILAGNIPLVFWDEFDTSLGTQRWGWLRHFLAPMQDGNFQEGQIIHPIGRAIFVFAGGTSRTMAAFERQPGDTDLEEFVAAKGPDFVSRLKGFVNIIGPNPNLDGPVNADDHYYIRRAILLRGMLERNVPGIFPGGDGKGTVQIDAGVLRAFLQIGDYRHGARSMESIIAMSALSGKRNYERSSLPSEAQLNIHVRGREFHALVQAPALAGELLEKLAAAAHRIFCAEEKLKEETQGIARAPMAHFTYDQLPEEFKEQNRANVRHINEKLASIGCIMVAARGDEPPSGFPGADMERLAEMEHDRWLRLKAKQGWHYGLTTDKDKLENEAMLPWHQMIPEDLVAHYGPALAAVMGTGELPEPQKQKDRVFVAGIPNILAEAGYTVAKL